MKQLSDMKKMGSFACYSGIWTSQTWLMWTNQSMNTQLESMPFIDIYFILTLSFAVFSLASIKIRGAFVHEKVLDVIATAAMCLSPVLMVVSHSFATMLLSIVLGAIGLTWNYLRWGLCFSRFDTRTALGILFLTCALGSVAKTAVIFLPIEASYPLVVLLPILSLFFQRKTLVFAPSTKPTVMLQKEDLTSLWKPLLCIAVFSFVCSTTRYSATSSDVTTPFFVVGRLIELLFSFLVLYWIFKKGGTFGFPHLCSFVLLFLSASLIIKLEFSDVLLSSIFSGIALSLIITYLWLCLTDVSHHSTLPAYTVFGVGWISYTISRFAGNLLVLSSGDLDPSIATGALLYILIVSTVLILCSRDVFLQRMFSDLCDSKTKIVDYEIIDEKCCACKTPYNLSDREVEVLQLLCKGRSKAYIAEALFVTENTVRSHTKRIYAKFNVHSKDELLNLVLDLA